MALPLPGHDWVCLRQVPVACQHVGPDDMDKVLQVDMLVIAAHSIWKRTIHIGWECRDIATAGHRFHQG